MFVILSRNHGPYVGVPHQRSNKEEQAMVLRWGVAGTLLLAVPAGCCSRQRYGAGSCALLDMRIHSGAARSDKVSGTRSV